MTSDQNYEQTLVTLANASYLGAQVLLHMHGERCSDTVRGEPVTLDMARGAVLSRIRARFKIRSEAAAQAKATGSTPAEGTDTTTPTNVQ